MNKSELMTWLREEHRKWEAFLDQIDPAHLEQSGVVGHWSIKDVMAHLNGWNRKLVARLQAAPRNEPEPATPWPPRLQDNDEINAWHYETNRALSVHEIREQTNQVFEQLFATIENLPDDVRIETIQPSPDRAYYRLWLGDKGFMPGEFFDHYRDDHEAEILAWLAKKKQE
ncbi:ClbS/DfsB family four-helix bundle protein [bacterium]|nr:ClbS/DfsB family four-helix bundle protein [bacterium]